MNQEDTNLIGDVVSIEKKGEEVIITKEKLTNDLNYADANSKDPQKPDMIKSGEEIILTSFVFPNKDKALEYYGIQLERCMKGVDAIKEGLAEMDKEIMDGTMFEQMHTLAEKMNHVTKVLKAADQKRDQKRYELELNEKYKKFEVYLEKYAHYKQGKEQLKIRGEHVPYFEKIIKTIEEL